MLVARQACGVGLVTFRSAVRHSVPEPQQPGQNGDRGFQWGVPWKMPAVEAVSGAPTESVSAKWALTLSVGGSRRAAKGTRLRAPRRYRGLPRDTRVLGLPWYFELLALQLLVFFSAF